MDGYGKRVLVVEDDDQVREVVASLLIQEGYNVHTVRDGQEALNEMKRRHFDVVLTDYYMPRMNGLELLLSGRTLQPDTPVVIISGDRSGVANVARQQGAYAWIPKPYEVTTLVNIVNEAGRQAVDRQKSPT